MRLSQILKAKLHHAHITYANPEYIGSIEIDGDLMEAVGIKNGEMVYVWGVDQPHRIETYAFRGPSGVIGLNGGAARAFNPGDRVIIAAFDYTDEQIEPRMVLLNENNKILRDLAPFQVVG